MAGVYSDAQAAWVLTAASFHLLEDAMILMLIHGDAGYARVAVLAARTLLQRR